MRQANTGPGRLGQLKAKFCPAGPVKPNLSRRRNAPIRRSENARAQRQGSYVQYESALPR
eukprot:scaffold258336_cov31-Prasinocladus_malaysianus.AAC.1